MATGFGIDPTVNGSGVITSGTTSTDIQRITGALYTPGLLAGATITTRSDMQYQVAAGVGCVQMAAGLNVLIPIPATIVPTNTNSSGSPRTDIIYATQNNPANDGNSNVLIGVTTGAVPANSVVLKRFLVPAGASNTNTASATGNIDYSIPYGTNGGNLFRYHDTTNGVITTAPATVSGQIYLPTDRMVTFTILCTVDLDVNTQVNWLAHTISVDGVRQMVLTTGRMADTYTQNHYWEHSMPLSAGVHSVAFKRDPGANLTTNNLRLRYVAGQYPGQIYTVRDGGVIV